MMATAMSTVTVFIIIAVASAMVSLVLSVFMGAMCSLLLIAAILLPAAAMMMMMAMQTNHKEKVLLMVIIIIIIITIIGARPPLTGYPEVKIPGWCTVR